MGIYIGIEGNLGDGAAADEDGGCKSESGGKRGFQEFEIR